MTRWADVLDLQVDVWKHYQSERGIGELQSFAESVITKAIDPEQQGLGPAELQKAIESTEAGYSRTVAEILSQLPGMMWRADPIYVDPEMGPLIDAALKGWQSETLLETDLFIPNGFLVLPEPVYLQDVNDKLMSVRAFLWHQTSLRIRRDDGKVDAISETFPGMALVMFSDINDEDDFSNEYRNDTKLWSILRSRPIPLTVCHAVPWRFGDPTYMGGHHTGVDVLQCILRLMAQTVTVREPRNAPRLVGKRVERAKFPAKRITVVTLRRPAQERDPESHHDVEWSHRWIVDGHWRQQWYPSLGQHRQIWISPYVKGPAELPLVVSKAHVYQFTR
jgi:hypothetical protein